MNCYSSITHVLLAAADPELRRSLKASVAAQPDLRVVAESAHPADVLVLLRRCHPQVVVIDAGLASLLNGTAHWLSDSQVVFVAPDNGRIHILHALRLGARGIVAQTVGTHQLIDTIRKVAEGQYCLDPSSIAGVLQILSDLLRQEDAGEAAEQDYGLTGRELEVVSLIAAGHNNRQIAQHLLISERTVKHHLTNIFAKLRLSSRLELAYFAATNRLGSAVLPARGDAVGHNVVKTGTTCYSGV